MICGIQFAAGVTHPPTRYGNESQQQYNPNRLTSPRAEDFSEGATSRLLACLERHGERRKTVEDIPAQ